MTWLRGHYLAVGVAAILGVAALWYMRNRSTAAAAANGQNPAGATNGSAAGGAGALSGGGPQAPLLGPGGIVLPLPGGDGLGSSTPVTGSTGTTPVYEGPGSFPAPPAYTPNPYTPIATPPPSYTPNPGSGVSTPPPAYTPNPYTPIATPAPSTGGSGYTGGSGRASL